MIALCLDGTWNGAGLVVTRLAALASSTYAITVLAKMLISQPDRPKRLVPRSLIVFTLMWALVTAVISTALLVSNCTYTLSNEVRTLYGQSFAWSIGGLAFIMTIGARHHKRVQELENKIPEEALHAALSRILLDDEFGKVSHDEERDE